MKIIALVPFAILIAWLAYRFLLPAASSRVSGFSAAGNELREVSRLEGLLPAGTRHATFGEAYLTEDRAAVEDGSILADYDPEPTILAATESDFVILDREGAVLLTVPLTALALGLPVGYEAMGEAAYFYFILLDSNLALAVRPVRLLKSAGIGDDELGRWDTLLT